MLGPSEWGAPVEAGAAGAAMAAIRISVVKARFICDSFEKFVQSGI